jgi:hypothetical protein
MVKTRRRAKKTARGAGSVASAKTRPRPRASRTVSVETLREQADRLGLLDPLEEEPVHVFSAGSAYESEQ